MTLCTSALARLRSRASAPASRQPVDDWLDTFVEHWRLRHPHVQFELLGARPAGVALDDTVAAGQILTILLDNAARAQRVTLAAKVAHAGTADKIEFEVCDDGPAFRPRCASRSARCRSTARRAGTGRPVSRVQRAARLGGEIELSDVARGGRQRAGGQCGEWSRRGGSAQRAGQRGAERTTGTPDSRPAGAAPRAHAAVLRLPVVRVAASAASTNT